MTQSTRILLAALLTVSMTSAYDGFAQTTSDESVLTDTQNAIDAEVGSQAHQARTTQWAKRYQLDEQVITDLRSQGRGWGEISTELALAEHLTQTNPDAFPSMQDALNQIGNLRDDGAGWGVIAKTYDVKLGKLVSAGKKDLHAVKSDELRGNRGRKDTAMDKKAEKMHKPMRTNARPHKIDRPARPDRPTRPDRPQRPERPSRPHKPERPGR